MNKCGAWVCFCLPACVPSDALNPSPAPRRGLLIGQRGHLSPTLMTPPTSFSAAQEAIEYGLLDALVAKPLEMQVWNGV